MNWKISGSNNLAPLQTSPYSTYQMYIVHSQKQAGKGAAHRRTAATKPAATAGQPPAGKYYTYQAREPFLSMRSANARQEHHHHH